MDPKQFKLIIIMAASILAALYLGISAATAQFQAVAWVLGGMGILVLLALGRNVWALVPVMGGMAGFVNAVPGSPSAWYLGVALAGGMLAIHFAMRRNNFLWRWTWFDTLIALQILVLAQAYLRNPTGFALLGGDIVGGKPYVEYVIAIAGFFLMSFVRTDFATVRKVILIMILVQLADTLTLALSGFLPRLALALGRLYSNVDYVAASAAMEGSGFEMGMDTRFGSLRPFAALLGLICFSFWRPVTCMMPINPKRFILFSISIIAMLFSGFRSGLVRLGFMFVASSVIRRKPVDVIAAGIAGVSLLAVIIAAGQAKNLPFAAQRVLSPLPIELDARARAEAIGSAEWRFEMWKLVLATDRYIKNKYFGDGFGFNAAEQRVFFDAQAGRVQLSKQQLQDFFLAKGSYHGFHVETIRFTGVLGLIVATIILVFCAVRAYRIIRHYEGTPHWGYVMFICLPFLFEPFYYWLIFGSYKSGFVTYILSAGMLKMLDNIRGQEIELARQLDQNEGATAVRQLPASPEQLPMASRTTR
jgi:hypothetical protein